MEPVKQPSPKRISPSFSSDYVFKIIEASDYDEPFHPFQNEKGAMIYLKATKQDEKRGFIKFWTGLEVNEKLCNSYSHRKDDLHLWVYRFDLAKMVQTYTTLFTVSELEGVVQPRLYANNVGYKCLDGIIEFTIQETPTGKCLLSKLF